MVTATASQSIHVRPCPLSAHYRGDAIGRAGDRHVRATLPRRLLRAFGDVIALLVVVLSVPAALLLVGTPIALAIALLLRLARFALNVF